jgi:Ca2+-binding EF-hand superfamily protein
MLSATHMCGRARCKVKLTLPVPPGLALRQARIEHNKQRDRLRAIMQTVGSQKGEVNTADLLLSAKLAKIELPQEFLLNSPYAKKYAGEWDKGAKSPRSVKWRPFYDAIEYPKMQSTDQFLRDHAEREAKQAERRAAAEAAAAEAAATAAALRAPAAAPSAASLPYVSDDELRKAHLVVKARLSSQFGELRQAFRTFDTDGSGLVSREEAESTLQTLNLGLPKRISSRLVDIADFDGDGEISFAEFARVLTADDIIFMKNSLSASAADGAEMVDSRLKGASIKKASRVIKNGVTEDDIRKAVFVIKEKILYKYKRLDAAFKSIDADRTGFLSREEFRFCLYTLNLDMLQKDTIEVLIDLMDTDGDGQINHFEFVQMLTADDPFKVVNA